ncbi:hypothetical protein [Halorhabdus tiamatea]|uniref:Uncharacterized protein n=1 Tax=Halorhabdus tiamatea SARL4B TaxID=1033806 RepID=F7PR09_9EURY|nr:hypothetical protein [Halorhabdus tiamatea]CCQ34939.1 hypothetical protein HTIA_p2837 [Halorhabdus tiamatea SARL4B]
MQLFATVLSWLAVISTVIAGTVGLVIAAPEVAILWAIVGFFVGKIVQSTIWTVAGDTRQ